MAGGGGCVPGTLETGPPGPCPSSGLPNHCRQTAVALAVPDALLLFNRSGSCVRCPRRARGARAGYSRLCIPERLPDGHAQPAQTCAYNRMSWQVETAATLPAGGGAPGGGGGVAILSLLTTVLWMRDFAEWVWESFFLLFFRG